MRSATLPCFVFRPLLVIALAAPGCASLAADDGHGDAYGARMALVRAAAAGITPCVTTEAQLRDRLGKPTRDGRLGAGRVMSWMGGEDDGGIVRYLAVLLDARGTVADVYWDLPTEIPWTPRDHCLTQ